MPEPYRCGSVALVGRPNVGKSTLLNRLVGQKVSIVTPRPQTTRHRVVGVLTRDDAQLVFVDTPGLHLDGKQAINRRMNRTAGSAFGDADLALAVVEALRLTDEDRAVLQRCAQARCAAVVVNKVDRIDDKQALLPYLDGLQSLGAFEFIVPVSAATGDGCAVLERELVARMPAGPALYPADQVTDRNMRFMAAELVREQLMIRLRDEVPYGVTVEVERYEDGPRRVDIGAVIWVARDAHKGIVIGKGGAMLRDVGSAARLGLEAMLERPVVLKLWVKVREGWADDEQSLQRFGYE